MKLFTILGYGAARYLEASLGKQGYELLIGERSGLVLCGYELFDEVVYLLYRYLLALGIGDAVAKEVAQGEDSEGGLLNMS